MARNDNRLDSALLLLRVVAGGTFAAHGFQKLFQMGVGNVAGFFGQAGVPIPAVSAALVSGLEFFGGLALVIGLLTRLAGLGLMIDMLGAMFFVHIAGGFFAPKGIELVLLLGTMAAALALMGPGAWSIDAMLANRRKNLGG